jgi:hypothetical protein
LNEKVRREFTLKDAWTTAVLDILRGFETKDRVTSHHRCREKLRCYQWRNTPLNAIYADC